MSDARFASYAEGWRQRQLDEEDRLRRLAIRNNELARELSRLLRDRYGARSVYLFGSLARCGGWHESSDIDLAVEGIPADRYFEVLAELWAALPAGIELDLVPLELASADLLSIIKSEGIVLDAAA